MCTNTSPGRLVLTFIHQMLQTQHADQLYKFDPRHTRVRQTIRGLAEGSPTYAAETSNGPNATGKLGAGGTLTRTGLLL